MFAAIDLTVCRGDRPVITGLSFSVPPGRCLQVVGANGSGKTTLLRTLCGLLEPELGALTWQGEAVAPRSPEFQRLFVYLGHQPPLKGDLSALENLMFMAALRDIPHAGRPAAVAAALRRAEAHRFSDRPVRTLSAGQRRRVALALLCLHRVPLWLLDEPVTHLDTDGQALVARLVGEQLSSGGTVIAATHQDLGLPTEVLQTLSIGRKAS